MKYKVINELENFNLHDAIIDKMEINGQDMIWTLRDANITVENSQINNTTDMCIDEMKITFEKITIKHFIWLGSETRSPEGKLISKIENIEIEDKNTIKEFKKIFKSYCRILGHSELKNQEQNSYLFTIDCPKGVCEFILVFKNATSEWDRYKGKAWYVDKLSDIKNTYIDIFFKDLTSEEKDEIYFHKYMWHAFSYDKVDAIEGSKAIEELRKHKNNDVYVIFQKNEKILKAKDITYEQIYNNVLNRTWNTDCYIIDKEFKWTFVLTHETIDDDLDAMYKTYGRIPEDTIVDLIDKDFVIGPFYKEL